MCVKVHVALGTRTHGRSNVSSYVLPGITVIIKYVILNVRECLPLFSQTIKPIFVRRLALMALLLIFLL